MTTGEWLESLSSAPEGSTMLTIVAELEGTYPVLTPIESFKTNLIDEGFTANLDIITIKANYVDDTFSANFSDDSFTSNLEIEI